MSGQSIFKGHVLRGGGAYAGLRRNAPNPTFVKVVWDDAPPDVYRPTGEVDEEYPEFEVYLRDEENPAVQDRSRQGRTG